MNYPPGSLPVFPILPFNAQTPPRFIRGLKDLNGGVRGHARSQLTYDSALTRLQGQFPAF